MKQQHTAQARAGDGYRTSVGSSICVALTALAALAAAWAGSVQAQGNTSADSTVALYGVVDLGLQWAKSGSTSYTRVQDEGWQQSRLGLRGSEDLGNGFKAMFTLEGGLLADTGQGVGTGGSWSFNRQAFVALDSASMGRVNAGRMYTPMFVAVHAADPLGVNSVNSSSMLMYATDAQPGLAAFATRGNNMVRWKSPASAAWYVDVGYGFGEVPAPHSSNGRLTGGAFGYKKKPWMLLYSFQRVVQGSAAAPVDNPAATHNQAVSAAWNVNDTMRLMGAYVINKLTRSADNNTQAKVWMLGGDWQVTPAQRLIATTAQRKVDGSPRRQTTWTLGWDYSLSKRTIAYTRYRHVDNRAGSAISISRVPIKANSGDDVRAFTVGIRHSF